MPDFKDNLIVENHADNGGGLSVFYHPYRFSTIRFSGDRIINNTASFGGGIFVKRDYVYLRTLEGNGTTVIRDNRNFGVYSTYVYLLKIQNFIHSGNTPAFKNW